MRFFVPLIACILDENRMPHVENRMRNATHSDDCPHDASMFSRFPLNRINLLGNTFWLWFTNVYYLDTAVIGNIFIHKSTNWGPYRNALGWLEKIMKNFLRQNWLARKLLKFIFFEGISSQYVIRIIFKVIFPKDLLIL